MTSAVQVEYHSAEKVEAIDNGWTDSPSIPLPREISEAAVDKIGAHLVDYMGSDRHVAMAAWSSTNKWEQAFSCPEETIVRLLRSLMKGSGPKKAHASPFGHPHVMLFIVAPLAIWTQILRHRSWASFSLLSLRYTWSMLKFYEPKPRVQIGKAMSYEYGPFTGWRAVVFTPLVYFWMKLAYGVAVLAYLWLQRLGVAREMARFLLPEGTITRGFGTVSLRNALNFLVLRDDKHAQAEVQIVARDIRAILERLYPLTMTLWEEQGRPQL